MPIAIENSLTAGSDRAVRVSAQAASLRIFTLARYEKGHKAETHERVVRLASERFRKDGIDGVGVATLMADAGLTHGGFYAHFESKEALVREAVAFAFSTVPKQSTGHEDARRNLEELIDWYLSPGHRDKPAKGCAFAALAPDLARRPKAARVVFAEGAQNMLEKIVLGLPPSLSLQDRQSLSYAVMAQLAGTLQIARLVPDRAASEEILMGGRRTVRQIAGLDEAVAALAAPKRRAPRKAASL